MELLRLTIIIEDFHGTYAEKAHKTAAEIGETSSDFITPEAIDRAQMPFLLMRPWELLRPISGEVGPDNPLIAWRAWLQHLDLSETEQDQAFGQMDAYYRWRYDAPYPTTEAEQALPEKVRKQLDPYWKNIETSVQRLVISYDPRDCERQGAIELTKQGHKPVIGSGFYADATGKFRTYLQDKGDWEAFANARPRTIPPVTLRATHKPNNEDPEPKPVTNSADSKLLLYTLMRQAASGLGMGLVGVDNDPRIVLGLAERGFTVHTTLSRREYIKYFRDNFGKRFPNMTDYIDSYDGFNSGLGKLAGLDIPDNTHGGTNRRIFVGV